MLDVADGRERSTRSSTPPARAPAAPLLMVELRHLGGALGRYAGGALSRFDGEYLYFAAGAALSPERDRRAGGEHGIVADALAPASSGQHYLNFAEQPTDPVAFYGDEVYARLRRVKAEVDPLELFRGNHRSPRRKHLEGRPRGAALRRLATWPSRCPARSARAARRTCVFAAPRC